MSRLYFDSNGTPQPAIAQGVIQVVAIGASATQSNPLNKETTIIRLVATQNCWVLIGLGTQTPVAHTTGFYLQAGVTEYWSIPPTTTGQGTMQVGVIEDTTAGFLSLTEAL